MFDILTPLAHRALDLALSPFGTLSQAAISAKGPLDLVTEADRAVEALRYAIGKPALVSALAGLRAPLSGNAKV